MTWAFVLVILIGGGSAESPSEPWEDVGPGDALVLSQPQVVELRRVPAIERADSRQRPVAPAAATGVFASVLALVAAVAARAGRAIPPLAAAERSLRADDSTHDDIREMASVLGSLEGQVADDVVANLTAADLAQWLRPVDAAIPERTIALYNLVNQLSSLQLLRLIQAGNSSEVIGMIAVNTLAETRVELAFDMWRLLEAGDPGWGEIRQLLAGAGGAAAESVIGGWHREGTLGAVVEDLAGITRPWTEPPPGAEPLVGMVETSRGFQDPELKAALFAHAVSAVARWDDASAIDAVLYPLTQLIRSDPSKVVEALSRRIDVHGNVTAEWVRTMIDAGREDGLTALLGDLVGAPHRLEWFVAPGSEDGYPYPNAANLGFYVGTYHLAIEGIAGDAAETIALVGTLFSVVTGFIPGPKGLAVKLPAGPLVDDYAAGVVEGINGHSASLKQALWDLAKPRTGDGWLWNGEGTSEFHNAWEEVVEVR